MGFGLHNDISLRGLQSFSCLYIKATTTTFFTLISICAMYCFACSYVKQGTKFTLILFLSAEYNYHVFTRLMSEPQKLELLEAMSKCGLNYLSKAVKVALIHCLLNLHGSKKREKVRPLLNPSELDLFFAFYILFNHEA